MKRVLLITGGSRGIGAATALLAAQDGWAVAVNYANNQAAANQVVQAIASKRMTVDAACVLAHAVLHAH